MGRRSSPTSHTLFLLGLGLGLGSPPPPASSCVRAGTDGVPLLPAIAAPTGPSMSSQGTARTASFPLVLLASAMQSVGCTRQEKDELFSPSFLSVSQSVSHTGHFRHACTHPMHSTSLHQLTVRPHLAIGRPARRLHPSMSIDGLLGCRPTSIRTKKFIIF